MLTLFSIPKPFVGRTGVIQKNALRSWCALEAQVVLVGDEVGVAEAAEAAGAQHIGGVLTNEYGTPRLDDAFARVEKIARTPLRCFVNADIVLLDDFAPAVAAVAALTEPFLLVGETTDVEVTGARALEDVAIRGSLGEQARLEGRSRGATAIDYFVFTPGLFDPLPGFVVGRARFDNWLVWRARSRGLVVDASAAILAIHQHHDYGHIAGGHDAAHFGVEAAWNLELAGGKKHLFTIYDASHRLERDLVLRRHTGAALRMRENMRKLAWKLGRR